MTSAAGGRYGACSADQAALNATPRLPLTRIAGELREGLGRECGKFNGGRDLVAVAEIPERFARLAKRSEGIAQVFARQALRRFSRALREAEDFFDKCRPRSGAGPP